jgi:hypothetical protein
LLSALALVAYLVKPGDTLSGIASSHHVSLAAVETANPRLTNPNLIFAGQKIKLPKGPAAAHRSHTPSVHTTARQHSAPAHRSPSHHRPSSHHRSPSHHRSYVSSFQACVIARESGGNPNVMNASGHYGLYQFSASTWAAYGGNPASFGHASIAAQDQVFANAMAAGGKFNWAPYDGC